MFLSGFVGSGFTWSGFVGSGFVGSGFTWSGFVGKVFAGHVRRQLARVTVPAASPARLALMVEESCAPITERGASD